MKSIIQSGMLIALCFFCLHTLHAQSEQWIYTQQLLGNWRGPATLTLGDQSFDITYRMHFKSAVDGNAMTMDEGFSHPDLGSLKGANLIGLNASDGLIHWFSADNFGTAHEHTGEWSDNKHFHMEHQSLLEGQVFLELIDIALNANNTVIEANLVATLDGVIIQTLVGVLTKSNGGNAANTDIPNFNSSIADQDIILYPNPSDGHVDLRCDCIMEEIILTNEQGHKIGHYNPRSTEYGIQIDLPGNYWIRIQTDETVITKKLNVIRP